LIQKYKIGSYKLKRLPVTMLAFITLVSLLLPLNDAFAHPHVFVANRFKVVFDHEGLAGIEVKWVFDRYFSQMIAEEFDMDRNGGFDATEVAEIKASAFSNLSGYQYFTFIKIAGDSFEVKFVRDFKATLKKGVLSYEFLIPCHVRAADTLKEVRVSSYDPSYYTLVLFAESDAVTLVASDTFEVDYKVTKNLQDSYYEGQVNPYEMVLKFRLVQ